MCGLEEKMIPNYTHERIPRRADCLQWTGKNTQEVLARLTQHNMIGELYRDIHIQVYKGGSYDDTLNIGMWLVVRENGELCFYTDDQHKLMYQPISDELERLRAFAWDILNLECPGFQVWERLSIAKKHGITVNAAYWVSVANA